jgi:branched-chain amino acid transport system substrate-binding protein
MPRSKALRPSCLCSIERARGGLHARPDIFDGFPLNYIPILLHLWQLLKNFPNAHDSSPDIAGVFSNGFSDGSRIAPGATAKCTNLRSDPNRRYCRSPGGPSIPTAAQLAADEINAKGGVNGRRIEIISYDNHSSAADSVRAFQRAVNEDHVQAVIASYVSEVVLALEPWAARLKTVMITPGAASDVITENIAKDYERNKYTFHGYLTSGALAVLVCEAAKDLLVGKLKMKTAIIMSEDAAWTTPLDAGYEKCLPKIGLKVLDHIRFSPDTTDFTPIFNKIEGLKPDVMITGISHVGVQPTVQWNSQEVPIPMFGVASQATNSTFWKDSNGATEGVLYQAVSGPDVPVTPKTLPFVEAFQKKNGNFPSYCGYTAYDEVYYIADAVRRAGSSEADKLVQAWRVPIMKEPLVAFNSCPRAIRMSMVCELGRAR